MTQFVIVVGTYNLRSVRGVLGPFASFDEAEQIRLSHNFGPNGAKVFPISDLSVIVKKDDA